MSLTGASCRWIVGMGGFAYLFTGFLLALVTVFSDGVVINSRTKAFFIVWFSWMPILSCEKVLDWFLEDV